MLKELRVVDFAIVRDASVTFGPGFNALTGETGAGKSIIVSAVELAIGGRPSEGMIRSGVDQAVVEARFDISDAPNAREALDGFGVEPEDNEVVIRRIISRTGKNRVYINGAMATVGQIREFGESLAEIHGQHETQSLFRPSAHLPLFDLYAGLGEQRKAYTVAFRKWRDAATRLAEIQENTRAFEQKLDLLRHQVNEIHAAELRHEEEETLAQERAILGSVEKLLTRASIVVEALEGEERGATLSVKEAKQAVEAMGEIDEVMAPMAESLADVLIRLEDTIGEIRGYAESLEADPIRLDEVEERLELIKNLKRKYGEDINAILTFGQKAEEELEAMEIDLSGAEKLEKEVARLGADAATLAIALDVARKQQAVAFAAVTERELADLAMPSSKVVPTFRYDENEESFCRIDGRKVSLSEQGAGKLEILFSANPGETPKPLTKIASGGEISRIMLAIKTTLADRQPTPVMVFDEIDTGVGGVTANRVGEKLRSLSKRSQVFCVTHLAQIASLATGHYTVSKSANDDATAVVVKKLDYQGRVAELGRMVGDDVGSDAALKWAEQALKAATEPLPAS